MPRLVPLPPEFADRAFTVADAREAGLGRGRLRGRDIDAPFYGVRASSRRSDPAPGTPSDAALPDAALPGTPLPDAALLERCRDYALRMLPGQFFSHLTAARLWGAPLPGAFSVNEPLHVSSLAPQRPPHTRGVIGHELSSGAAAPVLRHGVPVADPTTTWVYLAALLPPAELVVIGDHLVLDPYLLDPVDPRPFTTLTDLGARVASHRGRGKRAAVRALARVRIGAESRPETLLRLLMVDAGLPEPLLNQVLRDAAGRFLGRVDMVYPQWRVVVEYDGDQHRTSARQYERDLGRLDDIRRAGWTVIQVRKHGLLARPDVTLAKVRRSLHEAGWRE